MQESQTIFQLKKLGYLVDEKGKLRRKTVLERYYEQGVLELEGSPVSAKQRTKAGEILARDYYLGNSNHLQSIKLFESNIPTTGDSGIERSLYYKNRYLKAIKYVPYEFWPVLYTVCIEDKKIMYEKEKYDSELKNKNNIFHLKMLLVLGLERLLKYYLQKNKKSS